MQPLQLQLSEEWSEWLELRDGRAAGRGLDLKANVTI